MENTITLELQKTMHSLGDLMPVHTNEDGKQLVYGRELHQILGIKERYTQWMSRMIKDLFLEENTDYVLVAEITETNNPRNRYTKRTNHKLTVNSAKEIAAIQRTKLGHKIRQYLIAVEETYTKLIRDSIADQSVKEMLSYEAKLDNRDKKIKQLIQQGQRNNAAERILDKFKSANSKNVYDDTEVYQAIVSAGSKFSVAKMWKDLHVEGYLNARKHAGKSYNIMTQKGIDSGWFSFILTDQQTGKVRTPRLGFTIKGLIAMEEKYNTSQKEVVNKKEEVSSIATKEGHDQWLITMALMTVHGQTVGNMEACKALLDEKHIPY